MLRILSWSSGLGCDKMHTPEFNMFVPKSQAPPLTDLSLSPALKRKRSPSVDTRPDSGFADLSSSTKVNQGSQQSSQADTNNTLPTQNIDQDRRAQCDLPLEPANMPSDAADVRRNSKPTTATRPEARLKNMRQTIDSQLSLEILLKHKELRLIDQEIAKCQIALEQLRRCSEIPYPATQQPSLMVSEGTGPAIRRLGERYPAESPAPWGVADGPYSKHYAKWLLPDRQFDGGEPDVASAETPLATPVSGRSTRGHYVDVLGGKSVKSRSHRASNLQSLPAGYAQPKEKATGPMILKRKSDGKMVKLVCPDCGRHDFGSAQGFINHCRIGHTRSFASHDAAAEACGEPVEYNDNGTIKGIEPIATPSTAHVHPLVRSAKLLPPSSSMAPAGGYIPRLDKKPVQEAPKAPLSNFYGSTQTPHLSALMGQAGLGLNLQELVAEAKIKIEQPESDAEDDEMELDSPRPMGPSRHPQVAGSKQPVKSAVTLGSTKSSGARQTPLFTHASTRDAFHGPLPSPTNESTQAPSLVDDDEEFDPQSPASSHDIEEHDVDFEAKRK